MCFYLFEHWRVFYKWTSIWWSKFTTKAHFLVATTRERDLFHNISYNSSHLVRLFRVYYGAQWKFWFSWDNDGKEEHDHRSSLEEGCLQETSPRYWAHHGIGEVLGKAQASLVVQGEGSQAAYRREGNIEVREIGFGGWAVCFKEASSRTSKVDNKSPRGLMWKEHQEFSTLLEDFCFEIVVNTW